jgi:hypothetical protein
MRGWANYFKHAVAKHTFGKLDDFTFWRIAHMLRARHRWNWGPTPPPPDRRHRPVADHGGRNHVLPDRRSDGLPLHLPGKQDPNPMANHEPRLTAATVESPLLSNGHGGFGERPGETGRWQHRNRAPGRLDTRRVGTPPIHDRWAHFSAHGPRELAVWPGGRFAARDSNPEPADNWADLLDVARCRPKLPSDLGVCREVMVRRCCSVPDVAG